MPPEPRRDDRLSTGGSPTAMVGSLSSGDVIGRSDELASADRFLARASSRSAVLVLEGVAGIGKTTILDGAVDAAGAAGYRVLRARPAESERGLTLGGLTDLFAAIDDATLAALPSPQRRALEVALLRAEPSGEATDQRTLAVAASGLLRTLATPATPVLLAIDDIQWLDESSAAILAYATRRLDDRPVGVLLSLRTGAAAPRWADDLLAAQPAARVDRIVVGPMPLAALHQLFRERFGRSFPRVTLVRIEEASSGNPFYALEIARTLARTGAIVTPSESLPVPETLAGLVGARIAALPPPTRRALLLAAASAEPTLATLERADPTSIAALDAAVAEGVISIDGGTVRFAHPLLSQSVMSTADAGELRAVHATLAMAVSSEDARARHAGQAAHDRDEAVAVEVERAAAAARSRGATLDAAALYERASVLTPEAIPDEALRRARLAAECLFVDISEIVQADAILERALSGARPGPARAEAASLRAIIWYYHGRIPESVELCEEALPEAGDDSVGRARVLVRLAFLRSQLDVVRGLATVDEAVGLLEACEPGAVDPDLLANALLLRASTQLTLVEPNDPGDIDRGLALISPNGRSWERENADGIAFGLARLTDDLDRAIAMTHELIRSKSGAAGDDPFNLVQLSGLLVQRGDLPEARRVAEAATEGYEREGSQLFPSWRLRGLALVAAHDGRLDDARSLAREGLELALADGNLVLATFHHHILGFVALSLGEHGLADEELTAAAELAEQMANRHPARFKLDGDRVEAALALGSIERAADLVGRLERAARIVPTPWVRAVGARCRGMLDAATGDLDGAIEALERALVEHEALPMPFELARTLLAKGQVHRRRKEKRRAADTLSEAISLFAGLGTPLWTERARLELARVGLRPTASDELTTTERRVAELAAAGMRTPRIAELVFLSPKTVGNVLGRVYQKLGIHSRAELGAVMARGDARLPDPTPASGDES
jgi:DNA-binding CsgD family transcriptional regulator